MESLEHEIINLTRIARPTVIYNTVLSLLLFITIIKIIEYSMNIVLHRYNVSH